jgi:hypothetical protein
MRCAPPRAWVVTKVTPHWHDVQLERDRQRQVVLRSRGKLRQTETFGRPPKLRGAYERLRCVDGRCSTEAGERLNDSEVSISIKWRCSVIRVTPECRISRNLHGSPSRLVRAALQ